MKLTNYQRDAFIRAAMNDVPEVDYNEQARKLLTAASLRVAPKAVQALHKTNPEWVNTEYVTTPRGLSNVQVVCPGCEDASSYMERHAPEAMAELGAIAKEAQAQQKARTELERSLKSVAYSATTRKALATLLPEFEKYLPADDAQAVKTLPAVANVVADFTKAGWPKGKKPAAKTAKAA